MSDPKKNETMPEEVAKVEEKTRTEIVEIVELDDTNLDKVSGGGDINCVCGSSRD